MGSAHAFRSLGGSEHGEAENRDSPTLRAMGRPCLEEQIKPDEVLSGYAGSDRESTLAIEAWLL
jgi:hypothetical protein